MQASWFRSVLATVMQFSILAFFVTPSVQITRSQIARKLSNYANITKTYKSENSRTRGGKW